MDNAELHYYPGWGATGAGGPLGRYLPPLPPGMLTAWLAENVPPGGWLLDPLGASPALALEAARAGYPVLVACNNPILSFIIETLAGAPKSADFQSALAELATTRRGEERLEVHLKKLYQTECDTCGAEVQAQAYLWRKGEPQPFARLYHCPRCGESGERPVTPGDLERLSGMGGDKLQRARALQRVIMNEDEQREDVEEALESYLARPLYVLFTLINKLEGLGLPPERLRLLQAMLISTFDAGSTLWPWPAGRSRPRQLTVPPQFRENNLWLALEEAAQTWAESAQGPKEPKGSGAAQLPVRVTHWPELPKDLAAGQGAICLFRGRVKALMPLPDAITPKAVLTVYPRPNQAFWTLSVLWAGWLWGPEAALPLRNVLDRRRYDWNWHTSAIHNALSAVGWSLPPETPFFGLLPESAPGFLSAVVVAAGAAGFRLEGLALRGEQDPLQGLWRPLPAPPTNTPAERTAAARAAAAPLPSPGAAEMEAAAREAIRADLLARGEPAAYLNEYAAGLLALSRLGAIPRSLSGIPGDLLTRVQAVLARTFADRTFLRVYGGGAEEERGAWYLAAAEKGVPAGETNALPLSDRVEMEVVRYLQKHASFSFNELDQAMCAQFTGLFTPLSELVRTCLDSYGELAAPSGQWKLGSGESTSARKTDLQEMRAALETAGRLLGYTIREDGPALLWENESGPLWRFYPMASSIISRYVLGGTPAGAPGRPVLVIPGSRAQLLHYKLRRDQRLEDAVQGWGLLKFRHLREIIADWAAAPSQASPAAWESRLAEDPLTDEAKQMELFV